jgi:hypothetical protein
MTSRGRPFAVFALGCLVVAACSSGGTTSSTSSIPQTAVTNVPETAATTVPDTSTTMVPGTTTSPTTTTPQSPPEFHSDGVLEQDWYWLRDSARATTAEWTLLQLPPEPADINLDMAVLATDTLGTRGLAATFTLSYGTAAGGGGFTEFANLPVSLPNTSPAQDPLGFTSTGVVTLDRTTIPSGTATLVIRTGRPGGPTGGAGAAAPPPAETYVAFRAESLRLGVTPLAVAAFNPDIYQGGEFSSDGDFVNGWWWLRDDSHQTTATWNYQDIPAGAADLNINFAVLATDRQNGDRGYDASFYVSFGPIPDTRPLTDVPSELVTLPNVSPDDDPVGYTCEGVFTIPRESLPPGTDRIWMKMSRVDSRGENPIDLHIAFQQASVTLSEGATTSDSDSADDAIEITGGSYGGSLDAADTEDWYKIYVEPKSLLAVFSVPPAGAVNQVTLFDPSLTEKATSIDFLNGVYAARIAADDAGGYWYIRISRVSGEGQYTFSVTNQRQNDAGTGGDAGDTYTTATPLFAGTYTGGASGRVMDDDPADFYRITLDPGQTLTMVLSNPVRNDPWSGATVFKGEFRRSDGSLIYDAVTANGTVTMSSANSSATSASGFIAVKHQSGRGGPYDLTITITGTSSCDGVTADARDFYTEAPSSLGWNWLDDDAKFLTATWLFDVVPTGTDDVRLSVNLPIRNATGVEAGTPQGRFYLLYGALPAPPSARIFGPMAVTLQTETNPATLTGYSARGEITIPRADLQGAGQGFWLRIYRADPDGVRSPIDTVIGVAQTAIKVCLGNQTATALPLPSAHPAATVSMAPSTHVLTSTTPMFVDPGTDLDGDGLNQNWETAAINAVNPLIEVDEEELWLQHRDDQSVANFLRVYPWPSITHPQYIIFSFLEAWSMDYGSGVQNDIYEYVKEKHRGDSERILEAWKIIDDTHIQLEWVMTSAHYGVTLHSGLWHVDDPQCNIANIANQDKQQIGTELMCAPLEFAPDGRLKMYTAEDKHGTYPTASLCNGVRLVNIYGTWWGENCGWDPSDYLPFQWENSDFTGDARYKLDGRWIWTAYNVGEPDNHLIDDLDNGSTWRGLTDNQGLELAGSFPHEAIWAGNEVSGDFCGGMTAGGDIPSACSTRLGGKLESTPVEVEVKLRSAYRITVNTAMGWGGRGFIWAYDAAGRQVAAGVLSGQFLPATDDIFYLPAEFVGGPIDHVVITQIGRPSISPPWLVHTIRITDLATQAVTDLVVDRVIPLTEEVRVPPG